MLKGLLLFLVYRALTLTWRIRYQESPQFTQALSNRDPIVLAHWHGEELALLHLAKRYRLATLVSQSRDGNVMNTLLNLLGAITARGSSSRGGAGGLRHLIKVSRAKDRNISFAVDGPRGPYHQVKPGVFECSRILKAPIYVVYAEASRYWSFYRAWNKAVLPKPFALVTITAGYALPPVTKNLNPRDPVLAKQLQDLLPR